MKLASSLAAVVALTLFGSAATAGVAVGNPGKLLSQSTTDAKGIVIIAALKPSNSLVPIAGVNRSVPLAGSGNGVISAATEFVKNDVWVVDTGIGLTGNGLQPIADPNMQNSDPTQSDPRHPEPTQTGPILHGPINDGCPPCDLELRFGLGGSAERIAGEAKDTGHKDW